MNLSTASRNALRAMQPTEVRKKSNGILLKKKKKNLRARFGNYRTRHSALHFPVQYIVKLWRSGFGRSSVLIRTGTTRRKCADRTDCGYENVKSVDRYQVFYDSFGNETLFGFSLCGGFHRFHQLPRKKKNYAEHFGTYTKLIPLFIWK